MGLLGIESIHVRDIVHVHSSREKNRCFFPGVVFLVVIFPSNPVIPHYHCRSSRLARNTHGFTVAHVHAWKSYWTRRVPQQLHKLSNCLHLDEPYGKLKVHFSCQ